MTEQKLTYTRHYDQMINRNLDLAVQKVDSSWFPANEALVAKIRQGLTDGVYDLDIEFLIDEVKTDFSLFTYCLKELSELTIKAGKAPNLDRSPAQLMRDSGIETIKRIFEKGDFQVSSHSLKKSGKVQLKRLQEGMISASTAELLSEKKGLDPDFGYSTALLRQLGLTLIAWNYPQIYSKVIAGLKDGGNLDAALTRELGFSPQLLGIVIARRWNLPLAIRDAIGDPTAYDGVQDDKVKVLDKVGERLEKICLVGEALARASNPTDYPTAKDDWQQAKIEIEATLGDDGIRTIQRKIQDNIGNYVSYFPEAFKDALDLNPEAKLVQTVDPSLISRNRFVRECPAEVQAEFKTLYEKIDPARIDKENILALTKKIIPMMGFTRGCIYLIDPTIGQLIPRLKIGDPSRIYDTLSIKSGNSDPAPELTAFECSAPIIEERIYEDGSEITCIASVIGKSDKAGVLYLEMSDKLRKDARAKPFLYFRAICTALNDSLNLQ